MDATTSMAIQAVAVSVFIAAGSWGAVRGAVIAIAAQRYLELRAERYPELGTLPKPRMLARTQLLVTVALCWPSAVVFVLVRFFGITPAGPWLVLLAVGPVAAIVAGVLSRRSPWSKFRGALAAAARVPLDKRDAMLEQALAEDPSIGEPGA